MFSRILKNRNRDGLSTSRKAGSNDAISVEFRENLSQLGAHFCGICETSDGVMHISPITATVLGVKSGMGAPDGLSAE